MLRLRSEGIVAVPLRETVERHIVVAVGAAARGRPSVTALIAALRAEAEPGTAAGHVTRRSQTGRSAALRSQA